MSIVIEGSPTPLMVSRCGGTGFFVSMCPARGPGNATGCACARPPSRSASRFQPEGPLGPSQLIDRVVRLDRPGLVRDSQPHRQVIYEMPSGHVHRGRNLGGCGVRLPALVDGWHDHARGHAGLGIRGSFRVGLRRRSAVCAVAALRRPDAVRRFVNEAPSPRPRRDPRRGLQPFRPGRQLPQRVQRPRSSALPANGATSSTSTVQGRLRFGAFVDRERRLLDREFHFDGLRLDATQAIKDARTSTSSRRSPGRREPPPAAGRCSSSARASRRMPGS